MTTLHQFTANQSFQWFYNSVSLLLFVIINDIFDAGT